MSSSKRPNPKDDRRAQLARLQADQRRAEKRRNRMIFLGAAVVALALIIPTAVVLMGERDRQAELAGAADEPIEGVVQYDDVSAVHTAEPVTYPQSPPAGGDHHPTWQNCGFYTEPLVDEHAVHSLEHGAVWITHDPDLDAGQVGTLRELAERHSFVLVSPYEDISSPVVASAWGLQLELESVDDERLEVFLAKYLQGPQTPEPGAACHGGVGA